MVPFTGLSPRQIADHLGPSLALQQRRRFREDSVLIVGGMLVSTRDHAVAEQSKNHRYSTNHQVVIEPTPGSSSPSAGRSPAPQRLQGLGTVRCEGRRRPHQGDRRRRLTRHRPGHPAPP
jgi:hypothetical protein